MVTAASRERRVCPSCNCSVNARRCPHCGLDLDLVYMPYGVLLLTVMFFVHLLELSDFFLRLRGSVRWASLAGALLCGCTLFGIARLKRWGRILAIAVAGSALIAIILAHLMGRINPGPTQLWARPALEAVFALSYLLWPAAAARFGD